jgi:hypothetical protein
MRFGFVRSRVLTGGLGGADTRLMSAVPTTPSRAAAETVALPRALLRRLALPLVFVAATAYHFLQSRGHATQTVFNDELLYAKLSQAIAAGEGLAIRGEEFFFPAPLAPLVQAPAWLLGSMTDAYTAAKLINAVAMSAAVFPAYWLAQRIVRPSFALLTAAAAVATPAMVYHGYLTSEALAYPVFLLAVAVLAHAVAEPSRRTALAIPAVCALAVGTRVQFLVLPLAYLAAVAVCARGGYRRHAVPAALTGLLVALLVGIPGALGQYGEATQLGYAPGAVAHWALTTGSLLPFAVGLAIVPGALFGLQFMVACPRRPIEQAAGMLTIACLLLFLAQAALIAAGEAERPLERYLFYVIPLVFLAFFAYAERGAPGRLQYVLATCAGAVALSLVSLPGMTGTAAFFFDSVTLSAFARAAHLIGLTDASLLYSLAPLAAGLLVCLLPLRRRGAPELLALLAIGLSLAAGAAVYTTDRLVTSFAARAFGASPPDWLDRSNLGATRYLALPNSNPFLGTHLESWNRDLRGVVVLATPPPDPFPSSVARVARDGTLQISGKPAAAQTLVVNVSGSAIDLEGRVVARPRDGLVAYRIPAGAHVHSLARGLMADGWTGANLRYQAWPIRPGRYELVLSVPAGTPPRTVKVGERTFRVRAAEPRRITVPTSGTALELTVDVPNSPLGGRVLGVKVRELRFTPA